MNQFKKGRGRAPGAVQKPHTRGGQGSRRRAHRVRRVEGCRRTKAFGRPKQPRRGEDVRLPGRVRRRRRAHGTLRRVRGRVRPAATRPDRPAPPRSTPTTTHAVRGHPAASALMPPPPARSPHKKKRGGAAPRRNPAHTRYRREGLPPRRRRSVRRGARAGTAKSRSEAWTTKAGGGSSTSRPNSATIACRTNSPSSSRAT